MEGHCQTNMDLLLNPSTNDVVFINGDCNVTQSQKDVVAQRLKITLQTFKGEWFLDQDIGIPYIQQIMVKGVPKQTIDVIFQEAILNDEGVEEMVSYYSELDSATRKFKMNFAVRCRDDSVASIDFETLLGV